MTQKWYKSWALWLSIAALIIYILKTFLKIDIEEHVNGLMDVLLPVLIGFGVINNPNARGTLWHDEISLPYNILDDEDEEENK